MIVNFRSVFVILLTAVILFSSCVRQGDTSPQQNAANSQVAANSTPSPQQIASEEPELNIEGWLSERVTDPKLHTALVATLEPGRTLARFNADQPFNPASLIKIATTLLALKRLGPDYRFTIRVFSDGALDDKGTLDGNLYFSGSTPVFNDTAAELIADELEERGLTSLTGKIYVSPNFSFNFSDSAERSAKLLAERLKLKGKPEIALAEQPAGTEIFVFSSPPLREVLLYQNTHSNNFVAHRVGDAVGGVESLRQFLVSEIGLPPDQVKLGSTSGLEDNALTARGIFAVLRELDAELKRHNLQPVDVLPLASESNSTLDSRLTESEFKQAIAAKTGTLSAADGGVGMASLAGFIYTKEAGTLVFVLMDEGSEVMQHKDLQDRLLREILDERFEPQNLEISSPRSLLSKEKLLVETRAEIPKKPR